ncbi:flagellar hook-basal body complex protein FliE [Aestuariivirga sp.]|uniref:flagellar hook-basal body complex protein FliE n=1 Tax=Aestuariivirga sp. TaxID=2650926 RepID=UPI003783C9E4
MTIYFSSISSLPELAMRPSQAAAPSGHAAAENGGGFAAVLKQFAGDAANTVRQGEAAALAGISGDLPLQTVVERVMAAERTLQAALAVRDKAVSSYLEVSRMQI